MKKIITLSAVQILLSTLSLLAQNPICPIGTYIADPTARVWGDGRIYIYGSTDESKSYYCSYHHDVLYSEDLIHWDIEERVFESVRKDGSEGDVEGFSSKLFAPDAMYRDGKYFLYFCSPDRNYREGVAWADNPFGPFCDAQKMNIGKYGQIDPTVFIDDDGQAYYFWGQFDLKGAKMNSNMMEIDDSTINDKVLNQEEHYFHEGSFIFKRNDIYYLVYAHEGRRDRRPTCLGYATSDSPLGPYKYRGVLIDNFGCDPMTWNNHGSVAKFKDQWYVFYHRSSHSEIMMRRACVEPIFFNEDGSIDEVEMTSQGAAPPLNVFETIEAERACLLDGFCRIARIKNLRNEAICSIKGGDGAVFKYLNFGDGATRFTAIAKPYLGGWINIRLDEPQGRIIGQLEVVQMQARDHYRTYSCEIEPTKGVHALYLEFVGKERGAQLMDLDNFIFE